MQALLEAYENKRPEIIFEWKDAETEAEGWVVINSLRGGAAGGGTRMRKGLDRREVESLAKTMEVKFTVSGPAIGGAKSGINFDPNDPRKKGVLERWFKAVAPLLKNYYGTGGDMNIDEVHDVIPITETLGIMHPQEGVVRGHFGTNNPANPQRISQLQRGVKKFVEDPRYAPNNHYVVADMITGYGVAESVKHYYNIYGGELKGKRVLVQGWGNVASAAGYYLTQMGARITGIIDRDGGLISAEGFDFEKTKKLFLDKQGNKLQAADIKPFGELNETIWNNGADIFIPAAASRLITRNQVDQLIAGGLEVIACGANVPFADKEIFFGPTGEYADNQVSIIPDFISNCGMARVFAYLMQGNAELSDEAIFSDVSQTIRTALEKAHTSSPSKKGIAQHAFSIALRELI
ncbi:MAG: glutamate dehydrogenase/leucine dehydrogenase [Bacteroidetes bacterium]|nr:MAG: glutamate dehydrogenase/leucine dehydrogenase [Bacteroidota bacterium]